MAKTGHQRLAEALTAAKEVSDGNIVRGNWVSERHRALLVKNGYMKSIIRGWYLLDADVAVSKAGESALWFESIWHFLGLYLEEAYGDAYWLNPEASLDIHTQSNRLPQQLIVFNSDGGKRQVELPNEMSLLVLPKSEAPSGLVVEGGVRVLPLELALASISPSMYRQNPFAVQVGLERAQVERIGEELLRSANVASANRLIGAYQELGLKAQVRKLTSLMKVAGFSGIRTENPFEVAVSSIGAARGESPASLRVRMLWRDLRKQVASVFEAVPKSDFFARDLKQILEGMESIYVADAYHSLSIEGYVVTSELIEKVANGDWSPETLQEDRRQKDALAARGYYEAFQGVKALLTEAHSAGQESLDLDYLIDVALTEVYASLFKPCVAAGIVTPETLAGHRKGPIIIRGSRHMPPQSDCLMDCMDSLKELMASEPDYSVKAVLGHLLLGYIHPYPDGNGRTARFIMNLMLVLGGFSWTVITMSRRAEYLKALDQASVYGDAMPFASLVCELMLEQQEAPPEGS